MPCSDSAQSSLLRSSIHRLKRKKEPENTKEATKSEAAKSEMKMDQQNGELWQKNYCTKREKIRRAGPLGAGIFDQNWRGTWYP